MSIDPCTVEGVGAFVLRTDENGSGTGDHAPHVVGVAAPVRLRDVRRVHDGHQVEILVPDLLPALFVYGTLAPGDSRWSVLEPFADEWEEASARGALYDTGRGFPAARFFDHGRPIPGVRVRLGPDHLVEAVARLDEVEGAGTLYRRVLVTTSRGDAMSYEWTGPTRRLRRLPDGWAKRPRRDESAQLEGWSDGGHEV